MYKYIFCQWKNRKVTAALIIIGFMIGSFVMSLGISACKESFEYISDQAMGSQKQQLDIFLASSDTWNQKAAEEMIEEFSSHGEVQLLSMNSRKLEKFEENCSIVPVLFQKEPDWHVPILEGRYFSLNEMKHSAKRIILGKHLAVKYNLKVGDRINISDKEFQVIGICGRPSRETSWEYAVYMPWTDYLEVYQECFQELDKNNPVTVHLEQGKSEFLENMEAYVSKAEQTGIQIGYSQIDEADTSALHNTLTITMVSTILVFTIAVINIVHLMLYWLIERKREIGIMKALGADNGAVIRMVLLEVLVMSCLGCLCAIFIQYLAMLAVAKFQIGTLLTFSVTWENLVYAMGVSLFFGTISAIVPAWTTIRFEPVSVISSQ